ncbi:MAG: DUF3306 domain-containing protein [Alphaproteobacteria bacterium]
MSERDDDFLSRWSRRKVEARGDGLQKKPVEPAHKPGRMRTDPPAPKEVAPETEADAVEIELVREAALQPDQAPVPADASAEDPDNEIEEGADPDKYEDFDFDSLNYASDYTQFLKKNVPEAVRRRALRMLWGSNPILANIDGLNDYDEDFTDAALAVKVLSSNYKPGTGYLTEEERIASYSEEARKAGPQPLDEDEAGDELDIEDSDVEDMDDDDGSPDDVRSAAAPEGDGGDEDTSYKDDMT